MERYYSLIKIEDKLQSMNQFSGGSGTIFHTTNNLYAFPKKLEITIKEHLEEEGELGLDSFLKARKNVKTIQLHTGRLILIDPSAYDERALKFLADDLEEELELTSVFDSISQAGVAISSNLRLKPLLHKVMSLTEQLLKNEVSAVMLLDPLKRELFWEVSRGDKSDLFEGKLTLPLGRGIAGNVALTGEAVLLNDVYQDPRWDSSYDKKTGFRTRSMICVPIKFHDEILGIIEVINKKEGNFTFRDLRILEALAVQTGVAIENAKIHGQLEEAFEELKGLDMAKERVLNHLSHELKTPLALISGVLERIERQLKKIPTEGMERTLKRGHRNINRLLDLQGKIDDIVNQRRTEEGNKILSIIEDAASFVEEIEEDMTGRNREFLGRISNRIDSLFETEEVHMERINLDVFLNELCDRAIDSMAGRDIFISQNVSKNLAITTDKAALEKSFLGILRNAIENTPDEGRIAIAASSNNGEVRILVRDWGVGITEQNKKMIFGGFFHTQETGNYSTKRPYMFNAGGTGSDLLRIKCFSERLGFSVGFVSTRCRFIPTDKDTCSGKISSCPFIRNKEECLSSGGSTFSLIFPVVRS
ncbi:MAG: GAF domain-containing protein [Deltaproteobacteria bacterium]|nr:GAF domain-containing protein [Deltaproteobacteria bacterium]